MTSNFGISPTIEHELTGWTKMRPRHEDRCIPWETEWVVPRAHQTEYLSLLFPWSVIFVQGDSYTEFRAQRTDEGERFTWLGAATEGR
jgi:hypothetical protein